MLKYSQLLKKAFGNQFNGTITARQRMKAPQGYFKDPNTGNYHDTEYPESAGYGAYNDAASAAAAKNIRAQFPNDNVGYEWKSGEGATFENPEHQQMYQAEYNRLMRSNPAGARAQQSAAVGGNSVRPAAPRPAAFGRRALPYNNASQPTQYRQADMTIRGASGFRDE